MTQRECDQEKSQLQAIRGIDVSRIGFVCPGGFDFPNKSEYILIDGKELYQ